MTKTFLTTTIMTNQDHWLAVKLPFLTIFARKSHVITTLFDRLIRQRCCKVMDEHLANGRSAGCVVFVPANTSTP